MHPLLLICLVGPPAPVCADEPSRLAGLGAQGWVLRNERIARHIPRPESLPCTAEVWPVGGHGVSFGDHGFLIRLEGGIELGPGDFEWGAQPELVSGKGRLAFSVPGTANQAPLRVSVEYTVSPGEPFMRKALFLQATDRPVVVRDVQVERAKATVPLDLGGFGQPVFVENRAFWGLEYPAADNVQRDGMVTLEHHPGKRLEPGGDWWESKTAVLGMSPGKAAAEAFRSYLTTVRRPPRSYVLYNSWYDVQRGEMSVPVLLDRAKQLHEELTVKRGAPFDAVALDDGWQDVHSIWEIDKRGFPNGFAELYDGLKQMDVSVGLWHPLTAMKYNLDTEWGAANGYEVSPDRSFFCLSGPKYNAALRDELHRHTTEYEIAYFKHDFNAFACAGEGHGHLPEAAYGREANVDAEIGMFGYLRELNPRVYINPSGGMWLSPWWLTYVDTVWMQHCSDFGYNKEVVAYEPRDWAMTYRDAALWQNLHGDRAQFPVSGIMTIGIVDGKLNRLGGQREPLDRWANNVMVNVGRGSMLKELYITPSLLSEQQWDILASALKWQQQYVKQMGQGRMLPADPRWGGVYGWVHLDEDGGFVCLRNPGIVARRIEVPLPELGARSYRATRVYPFEETVRLDDGHPYHLSSWPPPNLTWRLATEVEPFGVTVIEVEPMTGVNAPVANIGGARRSVVERAPGAVTYDFWGQPGANAEVLVRGEIQRTEPRQEHKVYDPESGMKALSLQFAGEPYHLWDVKVLDESGRRFAVTVDEGVDWRFVAAAHGLGKTTAMQLLVDGSAVEAQRVSGEGWEMLTCPVPKGSHEVAWSAPTQAAPEPFSSPGYWVESFFVREAKLIPVRVSITYEAGNEPLHEAPQTPNAGIERSTWIGPKVTVESKQGPPSVAIAEQNLATAKAAKLHVKVFGSQGGEDYGRKWIVLNGQRLGTVPVNPDASDPDKWEDFAIDLSSEQMKLLRLQNEIVIETQTGDCFKFADLALAVQLADGRWAESEHSKNIWCSAPGWLHDEGKTFSGKTPGTRLLFRTK